MLYHCPPSLFPSLMPSLLSLYLPLYSGILDSFRTGEEEANGTVSGPIVLHWCFLQKDTPEKMVQDWFLRLACREIVTALTQALFDGSNPRPLLQFLTQTKVFPIYFPYSFNQNIDPIIQCLCSFVQTRDTFSINRAIACLSQVTKWLVNSEAALGNEYIYVCACSPNPISNLVRTSSAIWRNWLSR